MNHYPTPPPHHSTEEMEIDPITGGVVIPIPGRKHTGYRVVVDADDYPIVAKHRWWLHSNKKRRTKYAYTMIGDGSTKKTVLMHRMILDAKPGMIVDHVNNNGLDNRRANLRFVSAQENSFNQSAQRGRVSVYKGVSRWRKREKWQAYIRISGKQRHLGYFSNEVDAARAYDRAALDLFGEHARLNFPEEMEEVK